MPHSELVPGAKVAFVPEEAGHDWGGLYDRFIIASSAAIIAVLRTLERWVVADRPLSGSFDNPLFANAEVCARRGDTTHTCRRRSWGCRSRVGAHVKA